MMTENQTNDRTLGNMLAEIGSGLREIGKYYATNWGLIDRNPEYPTLARNTSLYINCKPYSVKRARSDAEQDLVRLAYEVPYEGSWFYMPKESVWYHVSAGHTEEFGEHGEFTFSSLQRGSSFNILGNHLVHYHTHPKSAGEHMAQFLRTEIEKEKGKNIDGIGELLTAGMYLYSAFPSDADIKTYVSWSSEFKKQGLLFQARVASPMGITTVEIMDPSGDVVDDYKRIYDTLFKRMNERQYVEYKINGDEAEITIAFEDMFNDVNAEMQQRMHLTFEHINCGIGL